MTLQARREARAARATIMRAEWRAERRMDRRRMYWPPEWISQFPIFQAAMADIAKISRSIHRRRRRRVLWECPI